MLKTKWEWMVLNSPKLTISIKLITGHFEYALKSAEPSEIFHIHRSRHAEIIFDDKCPRGLMWSTSRDTCQLEKINQNPHHHLV